MVPILESRESYRIRHRSIGCERLSVKRLAQPDSSWGVENVVNEVFDVHLGIGSAHLERKTMEAVIKPVHAARRELIDQPNEEGKATGPRKGVCVCVCLCTCR